MLFTVRPRIFPKAATPNRSEGFRQSLSPRRNIKKTEFVLNMNWRHNLPHQTRPLLRIPKVFPANPLLKWGQTNISPPDTFRGDTFFYLWRYRYRRQMTAETLVTSRKQPFVMHTQHNFLFSRGPRAETIQADGRLVEGEMADWDGDKETGNARLLHELYRVLGSTLFRFPRKGLG